MEFSRNEQIDRRQATRKGLIDQPDGLELLQ
jgi:hypothetical protein